MYKTTITIWTEINPNSISDEKLVLHADQKSVGLSFHAFSERKVMLVTAVPAAVTKQMNDIKNKKKAYVTSLSKKK